MWIPDDAFAYEMHLTAKELEVTLASHVPKIMMRRVKHWPSFLVFLRSLPNSCGRKLCLSSEVLSRSLQSRPLLEL